MAKSGDTTVYFDRRFFDQIMKSAGIERMVDSTAEKALGIAQANAPVDEGDYKSGLKVEKRDTQYRHTARVVGEDWKTMLIESKTGNLARALKAAKK